MPLWLQATIAVAVVVGLGLLVWSLRGDRARGRRRCPRCWYDMAGATSLTCPECGQAAWSERHLGRTRRGWPWATLGLALLLAAAGAPPGYALATRGWAAVPTPILFALAPWNSLAPTLPDGSTNGFAKSFAPAVQRPLPAWQQQLLARSLGACLRDTDPIQRCLAAGCLQASVWNGVNDGLDRCLPALIAQMDDADSVAAYGAACAVAQFCPADSALVPTWERLLATSPHELVRSTAASMLGHAGRRGDRGVIVALLRALLEPSDQVVSQAVYSLGFIGDPAAVPALILAACSKQPGVSAAACHSLELLGADAAPAVPALLGIVRDKTNVAGGWAIIALGRIGPGAADAVPDLISRLGSTTASQRARRESAVALGRIGIASPEVLEALTAGLKETIAIQSGCVEALYRLGWAPSGPDRAWIEATTLDKPGGTSIWSRMLLARADKALDAQVDWLISLLNGQDWWISEAAILALESLGPRAERALPALRALCPPPSRKVDDSDTQLKRQAAEPAIRHITAALGARSR